MNAQGSRVLLYSPTTGPNKDLARLRIAAIRFNLQYTAMNNGISR